MLPRAPNFIQQLTSFGIRLEQEDALDALVIGTKWLEEQSFVRSHSPEFKRSAAAIEQALLKDVPTANDLLNTLTPNIAARLPQEPFALYSNPRIPCSGPDEDQHFDNVWRFRERAHGVWTWSTRGNKYWLVQMLCFWKGALFTNVYLFVSSSDANSAIRHLFKPLLKAARSASSEELTRIRPFLISGRWLLLGSAGGAAVAVVDLNDLSTVVYLHGLRNASALSKLYLSNDRAYIVQLNTDGTFYVHRTSDGVIWTADRKKEFDVADEPRDPFGTVPTLTAGRWIDEEILLFTNEGYYWGSYEATHFVHLRLPGVSGLHPIAQFASLLNRPDIVRAAIKGVPPPPAPRLTVPAATGQQFHCGRVDGPMDDCCEGREGTSLSLSLRGANVFFDEAHRLATESWSKIRSRQCADGICDRPCQHSATLLVVSSARRQLCVRCNCSRLSLLDANATKSGGG